MNRAKVIGPSRRISSRMRATRRRPGRRTRGRAGRRDAGRAVRSIAGRRLVPIPSCRRRPGPTSVCPPSRIGIGAAAAAAVSSRSHGSATRPAAGGPRRTDPRAPARPTRRRRADGRAGRACRRSRIRRRARCSPSEPAPSRSSSAPRIDATGRRFESRPCAHPALLDERASARGRVALEPGEGRRGGPAGDEQLGPPIAGDLPDGGQPGQEGVDLGLRGAPRRPIRTRSCGPSISTPRRQRRLRSLTS